MTIQLKGNRLTERKRLDRIAHFDPRSKDHGIRGAGDGQFRTKFWDLRVTLDQGTEGACVGYGLTHALICDPVPMHQLDGRFAREQIYWEAQRIDPWPGGSYPGAVPYYEGTGVLDGVKAAHKLGYFDSYKWAFGLRDLIEGVGHVGPAILGLIWFAGMERPTWRGYIFPVGPDLGGHCLICRGVDIPRQRFLLHNSWGNGWGRGGSCWISFRAMEYLLRLDGEAVFLIDKREPKEENDG